MTLEPKDENIPVQRFMEGWVCFDRYYCTEGYIDRWTGSGSQDPNSPFMSAMTSDIRVFYRVNKGKWIDRRQFESDFFVTLLECHKYFTASEIFQNGLKTSSLRNDRNK